MFNLIHWRYRHFRRHGLLETDISLSLQKTGVYLLIMLSTHVWAMMVFEKLPFGDALWLTLTTVTTVGYGDLSATTLEGRISTILILFVGSIFVIAKAAGDYFEYRSVKQKKKIKGEWRWNMQQHIVIMNTPAHSGEHYFHRLIKQFQDSELFADKPIQILTSQFPNGLPASLRSLNNVVHYHGHADDVEALHAVNVQAADVIIMLVKREEDKGSDGRSFDVLHRLKDMGLNGQVLAECVDDENRQRLLDAGANIVIRPIRAYPEMIVRAFVAPGSERIIENMFNSRGDEYRRYPVTIEGQSWSRIMCALAEQNVGTAIAYISSYDQSLQCNPPGNESVHANAIFIMVREGNIPTNDSIQTILLSVKKAVT